MKLTYSWKGPSRPVTAEAVANHIKKLEAQYGEVTREIFLESARPEDSEMHKLFEWDDAKAAEQYRLHQASVIICSVQVTTNEESCKPIITRAFVQTSETATGYVNIHRAMSEDDKRAEVIERAKAEARWFISKYQAFEELADLIEAMSRIVEAAD